VTSGATVVATCLSGITTASSSSPANALYNGGVVDEERMKRIMGRWRMEFQDPSALRPEVAGFPVFPAMAMTPQGLLRVMSQNRLLNLPFAVRA
jgi:hypothetical protein